MAGELDFPCNGLSKVVCEIFHATWDYNSSNLLMSGKDVLYFKIPTFTLPMLKASVSSSLEYYWGKKMWWQKNTSNFRLSQFLFPANERFPYVTAVV